MATPERVCGLASLTQVRRVCDNENRQEKAGVAQDQTAVSNQKGYS
jgi:hypothetical protein